MMSNLIFRIRFLIVGVLGFILSFLPLLSQQVKENETPLKSVDYRIGPKDLIEIKVYELPELDQTVRVAEDGTVSLAVIGKVEVNGLTAQELEKKLGELLDQKYTKAAHVTVMIREHQKIAILGAVGRPGLYEMIGPTSLFQLLSEAGGLTPQAGKEIQILRETTPGNKERVILNLDEVLKSGQTSSIMLQPRDEIIVPFDQVLTVYVYGEVKTPGAITYQESKKITLLQAIARAGGLTEWANGIQVMIKRKDPKTGQDKNLWYNLKKVVEGKKPDIYLQDGDIIIVK
ncbi:MAG: SLBB domain-containing protein [Candidatus Aminicenantes bacterium]|nr:SLBB domain-containing protein [Candidatus Aminicenantes bacterium]